MSDTSQTTSSSSSTTSAAEPASPPQRFIDVNNSRFADQQAVMENILEAGHCPFCAENLAKYHKADIIKHGQYWLLTPNQWPYTNTKHHFLLIHTQHVESLRDITPEASAELFALTNWAIEEYQLEGGALALRFGDTRYSAATVKHLHAQLITPDIFNPDFETNRVRLTIGKAQSRAQSQSPLLP